MNTNFDIIYADPPWQFRTWSDKGKGRSADRHYKTMTIKDIAALQVAKIANENAALFMWVTWPFLYEARQVIEAWGFTYRTLAFIWVKTSRADTRLHMGTGYYTRANSEPCLLAVRGRMPVSDRGVEQVIVGPVGRHSAKPDIAYESIMRLYPDRSYIELFARRRQDGWAAWGNEIISDPISIDITG